MAARPRVFTVPPSAPFLRTLVEALVAGRLVPGFSAVGDPLALASATIYLPTRRAGRLAREVFLDVLGGQAALLPRLLAIGDIDEDEFAFADEASGPLAQVALDLPAPLRGFERRLLLAQLIRQWARGGALRTEENVPLVANNLVAALGLADALADLMDDMATRQVPWERLDGLVPDEVDAYWQLSLKFLTIAREIWPQQLAVRGASEPALHRDRLIAAEAERLALRHDGPVIAAGSTASMPATATLLATIARLPQGAVVLPGLDTTLDATSWDLIAGGMDVDGRALGPSYAHPQFAMHGFLARMEMLREEVVALAPPSSHGRERLVSEAMRPAAATEMWAQRLADSDAALDGIAVIEAARVEEESLAIAIALREAVETPHATAALVTSDRSLARRVVAALARWNVTVDDSGGDILADTPAGVFARLAAETALGDWEPVGLLALLKHPSLRLGAPEGGHAEAIAVLERALLRGTRPKAGAAGLAEALATLRVSREKLHGNDPRKRINDRELDLAEAFIARLRIALAPLAALRGSPASAATFAREHLQVLNALLCERGTVASFAGAAEKELVAALERASDTDAAQSLPVDAGEYAELFRVAIADAVVRRPLVQNARVRIFGLLEARLQHADRVVLGGLVEGAWPPQTRSDPWLSRPMRQQLGLDPPERRIGLTAHDFAQAFGAREVLLTRAAKVGGSPTVASRFVQRLRAVAGETQWTAALKRGARYAELARALDLPAGPSTPVKAPMPRPPLSARPARLSVTEIEHWLRDPYTIYAKHVLRLQRLDPVDTPPGARDRGTMIHGAIGDFTLAHKDALPVDILGELIRLGRDNFAPLADYPEAQAFWWPRFERIARWFAGWEAERRGGIAAVHAEAKGQIEIPAGERTFMLTARADRIERCADGSFRVLDYKTGRAPTDSQVRSGLSPQLPLEAVILRAGGFEGIPAESSVGQLGYIEIRGGDPAGEDRVVDMKGHTPDQHAEAVLDRLRALVMRFENEQEPYGSMIRPMWKRYYGDFDHLARVKEWSATAGESESDFPE